MLDNTKFRHFQGAISALDGSHIAAFPPKELRPIFRNHKGFLSQNCLFACNFSLTVTFTLTGMEGSVTDTAVWEYTRGWKGGFKVPEGRYYLGNTGYPSCDWILIPYPDTCYHLAEWGRAAVRLENCEELFNLHHAQLQNEIELLFGVLKRRFRILLLALEYGMLIQRLIPSALAAAHNFILHHEPLDIPDVAAEDVAADFCGAPDHPNHCASSEQAAEQEEGRGAAARWDEIAEAMWKDYVALQVERDIRVEGDAEPVGF